MDSGTGMKDAGRPHVRPVALPCLPGSRSSIALRLTLALIALSLMLAGCAERIADAKARSVEQAHISNVEAVRGRLAFTTACVVSGKRVTEFTAVQTGEHGWTGHVVVENPLIACSVGTACAIAPGDRYLTAAHCVDTLPITVLRLDLHMQPHMLPATVIWSDPVRDIAMISAPGCPDDPVFEVADVMPAVGDFIAVLGNWDELSAGKVLNVQANRGWILCTAPTRDGDSGGPVVDRNGRLVGVASGGMSRGFWTTSYFTKAASVTPADLARSAP